MKSRKIGGLIVAFLLSTNINVAAVLADDQVLNDVGNSQLELTDPLNNQLNSETADTSTNEEVDQSTDPIEENYENTDEKMNSELSVFNNENNLDMAQADLDGETEEVIQGSELDATIVEQGEMPYGEWIFYSDGLLTIEGNLTSTDSYWDFYIPSIKSIKFIGGRLAGDFTRYFTEYTSLEHIDFGPTEIRSVTSFTRAFAGLQNLKSVSLRDVYYTELATLTSMTAMFSNCYNLTKVDLSGLHTDRVSSMVMLFAYCSQLVEVDLSGSFSASVESDMDAIFINCSELSILRLGGTVKLPTNTGLPNISDQFVWQDDNNNNEFYTTADMIAYHNASNQTNVYRKNEKKEYEVIIPAKLSLNNENKLKVAAKNNGEHTLKVNLKNDSTQINTERQLLLSNRKDPSVKTTSQLSWEPVNNQSEWNILTVAPEGNGTTKESMVELFKPETAQAGSYEGTITFTIIYE